MGFSSCSTLYFSVNHSMVPSPKAYTAAFVGSMPSSSFSRMVLAVASLLMMVCTMPWATFPAAFPVIAPPSAVPAPVATRLSAMLYTTPLSMVPIRAASPLSPPPNQSANCLPHTLPRVSWICVLILPCR